jgi:hypothetical protein
MILMSILVLSAYEALYARPSFMPTLIAITLVLMTILGLASVNGRSFFTTTRFLLPAMVLVTLFVTFSIYLVQPSPFSRPLFSTVDAYRDFTNAARIVSTSGFRPENMVEEQYYAAFPAVPVLISLISIVSNVPVQTAQILMAVTIEILGVVTIWLFSTAVVRLFLDPDLAPAIGVLATILVWLQPFLISPDNLMSPGRLSIPLITLVMYLAYVTITGSRSFTRTGLLSIVILVIAIVPMHATSALVVLGFFVVTAFLSPSLGRRAVFSVTLIVLIVYSLYLLSFGGLAFDSVLKFASNTQLIFARIISKGMTSITEAHASHQVVEVNEISSWVQALPLGLVLSICTTLIPVSLLKRYSQSRRVILLNATYGLLASAGLSIGSLVSQFPGLSVDMRYFAYPVTGLVVVACALVVGLALRNVGASNVKGLVMVSIIVVYAFSIVSSPYFLYESNPQAARMIPTLSEGGAADFVSNRMQVTGQILTDWPFFNYVYGLMYSRNIGIENRINIVDTMYSSPNNREQTTVILRQYYLQNVYIENISPNVRVLDNVGKWNSPAYNKIFDSSTTAVYTDSSTTAVQF